MKLKFCYDEMQISIAFKVQIYNIQTLGNPELQTNEVLM